MEDARVLGDGVQLGCLSWRHSSRSAGSSLLLLHGMSSNALFWARVASRVRHRHVVALDLRGHGSSDRPDTGYTAAEMAADVARAIETLGLNAPIVVGHSWGAAVGLELSTRHPRLTSAIVLIDGPTASLSRRMTFAAADRQMRPPSPCYRQLEEAERDQASFLGPAWGEDLRGFVHRSYQRSSGCWRPVLPESGREQMVRDLYELHPEAMLPELTIPVLVLVASDDSDGVAPEVLGWWRSQAEAAAALCRVGQAERVESRHDIPLIQPDLLAEELERVVQAVGERGI